MTIQAIISNKTSMILCTDLQQTIDEYKSYIGVKKIFEIKKNKPLGIMINGFMDFEGVPLETLISEFKEKLGKTNNPKKIKEEFILFLSNSTPYTPIEDYLSPVLESFKNNLAECFEENGFLYTINTQSFRTIPEFIKGHSGFSDEFHDIIPEKYDKEEYNLKIWRIFSYELEFYGTQVIIAGYDDNHHYGSLHVINIYCNDHGKIIFKDIESIENCDEPYIRVFAMNQEAYAFISGVSDDFEEFIKTNLKNANKDILNNLEWFLMEKNIENSNEILDKIKDELDLSFSDLNYLIDNYKINTIQKMANSCEYVPRQVLCDFANSLIKLTALKQKLSLDLETVSSESDIALITKTTNFKWVKYN